MDTSRKVTAAALVHRIDAALGHTAADLVIRNVRVLNTATGSIDPPCDIAIVGDTIVALGASLRGLRQLDGRGRIAVPGFIDTHVHIESSMVTPHEFEQAVLARGTTTVVCDPHEIANVLGVRGIRYMLDSAEAAVLTIAVQLSSCVPASAFETSGARLEVADLLPLMDHPAALGLAEMMNFPGVIAKDDALLAKLAAFASRPLDGHAPLLRGRPLDAYLATGIRTDHECTRLDEAEEKLAKGMVVLLREGSVAKNVTALAALLTDLTWPRVAFCTDDRNPLEILSEGHIDAALRKAIRAGAPVIATYRAASLAAAQAFGLRDRGVLAPGWRADLVLLDDLEAVTVGDVVCGGRVVEPALFDGRTQSEPIGYLSVRRPRVTADELVAYGEAGEVPVIGVLPLSLLTEYRRRAVPAADGQLLADPANGILHACVLERHGVNGNIGKGFVEGFGPLDGAIGTSVGHDSHNLTVIGSRLPDMAVAVNRLIELQGGCVVVHGGNVLAELALPIAGLISDRGLAHVVRALQELRAGARAIGCTLDEPLLQLAFLPLPVIPFLKLTDHGLVAAGPDGLRLVPLRP